MAKNLANEYIDLSKSYKLARFSIVWARDAEDGIGKDGKLPWHFKEDMEFFSNLTAGGVVIMGKNTIFSIGNLLKGRKNIIVSKSIYESYEAITGYEQMPETYIVGDMKNALRLAAQLNGEIPPQTYIIGGVGIYTEALLTYGYLCECIYSTEIYGNYDCDTDIRGLITNSTAKLTSLAYSCASYQRFYYSSRIRAMEEPYLALLHRVLDEGELRTDRTGTGTRSIFGAQMKFDISEYFPLLTTKRMSMRIIAAELLWFISGSTDVNKFRELSNGSTIWDGNSSREFLDQRGLPHLREGDCGQIYGHQWRHWGATYTGCDADYTGQGIDQLAECIRLIREEPDSRRIIMSAWNVADLPQMALPPCHMVVQFYVRAGEFLDCQLYQRSGDLFLGVPFNIASYSLLTTLIAQACQLRPGHFIHTLGDAHIYTTHTEQVREQLTRTPYPPPILEIERRGQGIDDFCLDDFSLIDYNCWPRISAKMAV